VPRLAADHPRDMAPAPGIFGEHHVARSEATDRSVAGFDLHLSRKRDHVLALRHRVKVAEVIRRRRAKHDSKRRLKRGSVEPVGEALFDVDLFEV
jgi:hypothetical protein